MSKFEAIYNDIINTLNEGKNNQRDYKYYTVARGKIAGGWEDKEDAKDLIPDLPKKAQKGAKVLTAMGLKKLGIDPNNDDHWAKGMELAEADEVGDGDDKVENRKELLAYANKLAKAAFGDETDTEKVKGIVDNAIDKATKQEGGDVDWEEAAGIVTGSFNS